MGKLVHYDFRSKATVPFMPGISQAIPVPFSRNLSIRTQIYNEAMDMYKEATPVVLFEGTFEDDNYSPVAIGQSRDEYDLLMEGLKIPKADQELTAVFLGHLFSAGRTPFPVPVLGKASRASIAFYGWGGENTEEGQRLNYFKSEFLEAVSGKEKWEMTPREAVEKMLFAMHLTHSSAHLLTRKNNGEWTGTSEMLLRHSALEPHNLEKRMMQLNRLHYHI